MKEKVEGGADISECESENGMCHEIRGNMSAKKVESGEKAVCQNKK